MPSASARLLRLHGQDVARRHLDGGRIQLVEQRVAQQIAQAAAQALDLDRRQLGADGGLVGLPWARYSGRKLQAPSTAAEAEQQRAPARHTLRPPR